MVGILQPIDNFVKNNKCKDGYTNRCLDCNSKINKKFEELNKQKRKDQKDEYYQKNREKRLSQNKNWYQNNKNLIRKRQNQYDNNRYYTDMSFKLSRCISTSIRESLKGTKNGQKWQILVGYTTEQLKNHIENLWSENMSWQNYGLHGWHIDHIIPLKYRNSDGTYYWNQTELANSSSETFKKAWSLSNLQPKWSKPNLVKGNRSVG